MAGTDDSSFTPEQIESLKRNLSEFAQQSGLSRPPGLVVAVFAAAGNEFKSWSRPTPEELHGREDEEIKVPTENEVDRLIAELRKAFTRGSEPGPPCVFCIIPPPPIGPPPPPPPPPPSPAQPPGPYDQ